MGSKKKNKIIALRGISMLLVLIMTFLFASCGENKSDDSSMTEDLLNEYMKGLCSYNIDAMDKCCMAKRDSYDDSEQVTKSCRAIASVIKWEIVNISIDSNSAIAQVNITIPEDTESICNAALGDTVDSFDHNSEDNPYDTLASFIKKRAAKADTTVISVEIAMTKVNNKWYIVQSLGVNRIIFDIRIPVVSVFSVIGQ